MCVCVCLCVCVCVSQRTDMDIASQSPYVFISYDGNVTFEEDLKVVSTCKMDVHKFPFDTQSCNITVMSVLHSGEPKEDLFNYIKAPFCFRASFYVYYPW